MTLKPGHYPSGSLSVLRVGADRCFVRWTCCDRTTYARIETIERHIRTGRAVCTECKRAEKPKTEPRRGLYNEQPGAVIQGIMRAGRHDWWAMRGPMGR